MMFDFYDEYYSPFYATYGGGLDLTAPPQPSGPTGTISVPARTIQLPGGITFTFRGGTWGIGGSSGSSARDAAVSISNQIEQAMQQNLAAYQSGQISRDDALNNFDQLWLEYLNLLNAAGPDEKLRAVADRQRGGKFDWFAAYRDPISGTPGRGGPTGTTGTISGYGGGFYPTQQGDLISWLRKNLLWVGIAVVAILVLRRT
jgi:hypothetical protein